MERNVRHGWIIRHRLSDSFVDVTNPEFPQIVADATKATLFPTEDEAHRAVSGIYQLPLIRQIASGGRLMELNVEERAFHDAPPADANPEISVSRADILKRAHEEGAARRAAHRAARAVFNDLPSGVLLPHPSTRAPHDGFPDEPRTVSL